jgi:transposase
VRLRWGNSESVELAEPKDRLALGAYGLYPRQHEQRPTTGPQDADVLSRWERRELSGLEAGEILGVSERQFRRYRERYEEDGLSGLVDRRLGKASAKRVPVDQIAWMLGQYRTHHMGWNVKHFHAHLRTQHGFRWGYTWTKTQLRIARYSAQGTEIVAAPIARSLTPCSPPSRRGQAMAELAARTQRRPALTVSALGVRSG